MSFGDEKKNIGNVSTYPIIHTMLECILFTLQISMEIHSVDENINKTKTKKTARSFFPFVVRRYFLCFVFLIDYVHLIKLYMPIYGKTMTTIATAAVATKIGTLSACIMPQLYEWFEYMCVSVGVGKCAPLKSPLHTVLSLLKTSTIHTLKWSHDNMCLNIYSASVCEPCLCLCQCRRYETMIAERI